MYLVKIINNYEMRQLQQFDRSIFFDGTQQQKTWMISTAYGKLL
jgi:hypothetical protein